jgi:hypothetical protein
MEEFSESMLVDSGREALSAGSSNDRCREINVGRFQSDWFRFVDFVPQGNSFTAENFIGQILEQ